MTAPRPPLRSFRFTLLSVALLVPGVALVAGVALSACQENVSQSPCKDIPAGGCPLSHALACGDPTCAAAYACNPDGTWTLDHACPAYDASAPDAVDAGGDAVTTPPPFDAAGIDAPGANGGPGCAPLQSPDCPLGLALACPSGCCGCEDLFVCDDGAWAGWGTCGDAGIVPDP